MEQTAGMSLSFISGGLDRLLLSPLEPVTVSYIFEVTLFTTPCFSFASSSFLIIFSVFSSSCSIICCAWAGVGLPALGAVKDESFSRIDSIFESRSFKSFARRSDGERTTSSILSLTGSGTRSLRTALTPVVALCFSLSGTSMSPPKMTAPTTAIFRMARSMCNTNLRMASECHEYYHGTLLTFDWEVEGVRLST